jgi:hypothetical protein
VLSLAVTVADPPGLRRSRPAIWLTGRMQRPRGNGGPAVWSASGTTQGRLMSQILDMTADPAYRTLAEELLAAACEDAGIEVASVEFGERDRDAEHSWLCFVVDPSVENLRAEQTVGSALDHFALIDPGGILGKRGSRLVLTIYEIERSDEASISIREYGGSVLVSPWMRNQAVARVQFNYRQQH